MSLLVSSDQLFEIKIDYQIIPDKGVKILETEEHNSKQDTFYFKRPNWKDVRNIASASVSVDAVSGKVIADPYKYMDIKIKTLLKDWTITGDDGKKLEVSVVNIDKMHPDIVQSLAEKLEKQFE
jgi:hypothetical protein